MIIGLTGYAGVGKDEIAKILVDDYNFVRVAFADPIRSFLYDLNPLVACGPSSYLQNIIDLEGWDKAKREPQVRRLLQNLGLTARERLGEEIWLEQAFSKIRHPVNKDKNIIITDVRFMNEATLIKKEDPTAQIWRVVRPDVGPINGHVSESEMHGYEVDQIIVNAGTKDDLKDLINARMVELH